MDGQREELRGAVHRGERVHKVNAGLSLVNDLSTPLLLVNTVIILSFSHTVYSLLSLVSTVNILF